MVCLLQFVEDLSDRPAAEAVRARIDWNCVLGLELTEVGCDFSVLCAFRERLLRAEAGSRIFERLVEKVREGGWIKKRGVQRTDSTHVLAAVRRLNRVELLGERVRAALNSLAEHDPAWLTDWVPVEWFERYSRRIEEWRLPAAQDKQEEVMGQMGEDGSRLLSEWWSEQAPSGLRALPEIEGLRKTWTQPFVWQEGVLRLRNKDDVPPAHLPVRSPYDHQAHDGHKRDLAWFGYNVHFSETCDEDLPHLITHVVTTDATTTDREQTALIHQARSERDLCPSEHLLDAG